MNGAQSLFKSLVDAGITTCFANPGTSEMQLVYEIGMTDKVRPVLCLQEDVVTGAADGYARMKGAPAFTLLHVGSGFANGVAMLHNAGRAHTPIVNVVGANASYHQPNYPEHELINGHITDLARVVSHWSQEARSASNLGELGAQAARLAQTGKICTIVAPTNYHWEDANPPPIPPAPSPPPKVAAKAIAYAAKMLARGKKTGLVLGNVALHGQALETAGRIAAKTGSHSAVRDLSIATPVARRKRRPRVDLIPFEYEVCVKFLESFEQLIFVGALFPVATFAYKNKPTMKSAGLRTLRHGFGQRGSRRGAWVACAGDRRQQRSRDPPATHGGKGAFRRTDCSAIGQTLYMLIPEGAILVDEAATNGSPIFEATKGARAHDYLNPVNGGAIGGGLPMALGAAIACPDRKVVHLQADGSGMYAVQALWSVAREKAVVALLLKNDAYAILGIEIARVREWGLNAKTKTMLELDNPTLDWAKISKGLGVPATRAATAEEFHRQFEAALGAEGPHLIECQVVTPKEWAALEDYIHKNR